MNRTFLLFSFYFSLAALMFISCQKNDNITTDPLEGSTAQERRWTETRDFNNGTLGEKVNLSAQGLSVYDNTQVYEGDMSCRMEIREGETGYGVWGGYIKHPSELKNGDELWLRLRIYFPTGFDYYSYDAGNRLKFLRFHTATADDENIGYNDIYIDMKGSETPFKYIYEGQQKWVNIGEQGDLPQFDTWETYEFYVRFNTVSKDDGGEAIIRFWKNGKLLKEITDRITLKYSDAKATRTLIFTYWNGGAPQTQHLWVDDIVLTSDVPSAVDENGNPYIGMD